MENHLNPGDPKSYALRGLVPRVLEYLYDTIKSRVEDGGGKVGEMTVGAKVSNYGAGAGGRGRARTIAEMCPLVFLRVYSPVCR